MKTIAIETDTQINADFADIVFSLGNHGLVLKYTNGSCNPLYTIVSNMLYSSKHAISFILQ